MRGGYKGYYKGMALDSSYEYIMCKILESKNINFKVHEIRYQLIGRQYTPDFFIYNDEGELIEIIEIRGKRLNIEERIVDTNELREMLKIEVTLITEEDLKVMCEEVDLSYHDLKTTWRESSDTKLGSSKGEFNAMYGLKQSDKTKSIIGELASKRMMDEDYKANITGKLVAFNRANGFYYAKLPRAKRVDVVCRVCGKIESVTEAVSKHYKVCSMECVWKEGAGLKNGTVTIVENRINLHAEIKEFIISECIPHREHFKTMKLNRITTDTIFNSILNEVYNRFGIKDLRTISFAMCGEHGRKNMILYLRSIL